MATSWPAGQWVTGQPGKGKLVGIKNVTTLHSLDTKTVLDRDHQHQGKPRSLPHTHFGLHWRPSGLLSGAPLNPISPLCVAIQNAGSGAQIPTLPLSSNGLSNQSLTFLRFPLLNGDKKHPPHKNRAQTEWGTVCEKPSTVPGLAAVSPPMDKTQGMAEGRRQVHSTICLEHPLFQSPIYPCLRASHWVSPLPEYDNSCYMCIMYETLGKTLCTHYIFHIYKHSIRQSRDGLSAFKSDPNIVNHVTFGQLFKCFVPWLPNL